MKEISGVSSKGAYNIAMAKAVQGDAYIGDSPGHNMIEVGNWQYAEFVHKMTVASVKTNVVATDISLSTDMALKSIKNIYKEREGTLTEISREKLNINKPTKMGKCVAE